MMTPAPTAKAVALNYKPSSSSAIAGPILAALVPMPNLNGFSLGAVRPDAKPAVDKSADLITPSAPSLFWGIASCFTN
jgi:hypothetical protein